MADNQIEQPQNSRPFNPNEHLLQIKNRGGAADYLPCQWRLVWFRSLCPNGTIETEVVHLDLDRETEEESFVWNNETRRSEKVMKRAPGFAVFRAVVKDGRGGVATGTKSEKAASFPDFIEKAETGSISRALAALGYGTQFAGDEFDEKHRLADAPVDRPAAATGSSGNATASRTATAAKASNERPKEDEEPNPQGPMTEKQWVSIRKLCQHLGKAEPQATDIVNYLSAKELIAQLSQEYRQSRQRAGASV